MKNLVILGSGAAGTMVAAKMRKKLAENEWNITVIDRDIKHHYQPGWLFVPFGIYTMADCVKPKTDFVPRGVNFVLDEITNIDPAAKKVTTKKSSYSYDWLVVSTGCRIAPDEIDGLTDDWGGAVQNFYTPDGAHTMCGAMHNFKKGRMVFNIAEMPIKCPVAPLEFVYMADWFFTKRGVRQNIEIELVTPLTGAFTKSVANAVLGKLCEEKNIKITPNFVIDSVDAGAKTLNSVNGDEIPYDMLVSIPPNLGAQVIIDSEIADPMGYMKTNKYTLKSEEYENVYILGDATNVPTSKAGSVAHFECDVVCDNLFREINGEEAHPEFDGHSNCFIVTGYDKASLIDFNYEVEPLPGMYPLPGVGPFHLLGESKMNYWGKLMFRWVYFNLMLKGHDLPLEPQMYMAGKNDIRKKK